MDGRRPVCYPLVCMLEAQRAFHGNERYAHSHTLCAETRGRSLCVNLHTGKWFPICRGHKEVKGVKKFHIFDEEKCHGPDAWGDHGPWCAAM